MRLCGIPLPRNTNRTAGTTGTWLQACPAFRMLVVTTDQERHTVIQGGKSATLTVHLLYYCRDIAPASVKHPNQDADAHAAIPRSHSTGSIALAHLMYRDGLLHSFYDQLPHACDVRLSPDASYHSSDFRNNPVPSNYESRSSTQLGLARSARAMRDNSEPFLRSTSSTQHEQACCYQAPYIMSQYGALGC